MKNIIKDALILFAITLVAGILLAVVNEVTAPKIEKAKEKQKQEACKKVFADADAYELVRENIKADKNSADSLEVWASKSSKISCSEIYEAYNSKGELLGYIYNMTTKEGYGSAIVFMVGVRLDGTINAVSILSSEETVGLGLEADRVLVPQFKGKKVEAFTYTKLGSKNDSEIDAISSATITTNAFVNAVNGSLELHRAVIERGGAK